MWPTEWWRHHDEAFHELVMISWWRIKASLICSIFGISRYRHHCGRLLGAASDSLSEQHSESEQLSRTFPSRPNHSASSKGGKQNYQIRKFCEARKGNKVSKAKKKREKKRKPFFEKIFLKKLLNKESFWKEKGKDWKSYQKGKKVYFFPFSEYTNFFLFRIFMEICSQILRIRFLRTKFE